MRYAQPSIRMGVSGLAIPYTIVFSTATVDGRLADCEGYSLLSCDEDFALLHEHRAWADAVIVGSNTAVKDDPRLNVRHAWGRSGYRVVVDSRLRVRPDSRMFSVPGKGVLITTEDHSPEELERYVNAGIRVLTAGREKVDLRLAFTRLRGELGVERLLVEGGGALIYTILESCLARELHVTIAPAIYGCGTSLTRGGSSLRSRLGLVLSSARRLCGSWIHLQYIVSCNKPII